MAHITFKAHEKFIENKKLQDKNMLNIIINNFFFPCVYKILFISIVNMGHWFHVLSTHTFLL